jgi:predicted ATPase
MRKYILTGAPGAGKTAVLRLLEIGGNVVVEEAATDVIALAQARGDEEPWRDSAFPEKIMTLQRQRLNSVRTVDGATVFFDRSPVCTLALSRFLGQATSPLLAGEIDRVMAEGVYEKEVFFIRNLGFVAATAARRISFEESLAFEQLHEQVYRDLGFRLIDVPAGPLADRVALIQQTVEQLRR